MKVAEVLEHWNQEDSPPSIRTLYHLSGLFFQDLERFKEAWAGLSRERQRRMAEGLVEIGETSFEVDFHDIFRFLLSDQDPEVRASAVEGLFEDETPWLLHNLINLLRQDPSPEVRSRAAIALGRFSRLAEMEDLDPELSQKLRETLRETIHNPQENLEVRRRAVEAIAYFGDQEVREIITQTYQDPAQKMRVSALFAMGRSLDAYWNKTLIAELENKDPELRYEAAHACGELELKSAVPALAPLLQDADREVQESVVWALGQIGGGEARRLLATAAASEDQYLAEAAAEALSQLEFASGILEVPASDEEE
ncbi:MAG: HEAT repeat domain-containing protein [Chloroflexi bacterium]|nr:HEAT repeat domain-containing protein [Chloroflexota bacterium]